MSTAHATALDGPSVLEGDSTDVELTDQLLAPLLSKSRVWYALFALSGAGTLLFLATMLYTFVGGIGLWGNTIPAAWA